VNSKGFYSFDLFLDLSLSKVKYEIVKARSLLSKRIEGDSWFHSNHSMNVYRGCEFACAYCDGMSEYYHIDNYQTHIRIKENAPIVLRKELAKLGYTSKGMVGSLLDFSNNKLITEKRKPIIGASGGVSDSYQKAERDYEITRKVLELLLEYELPVFVLTKSDLVLRDLDLLKEINERTFANICFSITLIDTEIKNLLEPLSSSTEDRFEALKEIRKAGIHGGVMAMPIIPHIGDTYENMKGLTKRAKDVGSEFILFAGMTLKPGRQKRYFLDTIREYFPERFEKINNIYSNNNRFGQPVVKRLPVDVMVIGHGICASVGIRNLSIRHSVPGEYQTNTKALRKLLETIFYMGSILRKPRRLVMPFYELAVEIERGTPEIGQVLESDYLKKRYHIDSKLGVEIESIIKTGTCNTLESLKKEVKNRAKLELEKL
jgi:DNA repair photolyase